MFFYINNIPVYSYKEYRIFTIIQFCDLLYIIIPRFCYHEQLSIAGNCRMCLVELNNGIKPVIACATNIGVGIEILLDSLLVKKARENVLEFLLINHPLDCPICDQGGECDLQEQTILYGSDRGRFNEMKRSVEDKALGPIVKTIMTRCIHCTRCIRFSDEVLGTKELGVIGRGSSSEIKMNNSFFLDSELSGNIVDICPVGALTSKPFAFTARPWDLKSIETIDTLDSLHSNIRVDIKGNRILRILPRINKQINENWISDYIRFSYESIQSFRLKYPLVSFKSGLVELGVNELLIRLSWEQCFEFYKVLFNFKNINAFNFIISSGIGLFHANLFYFFSRLVKNSMFFIERLFPFNIDIRESFFVDAFGIFIKSNFFIFYDLDLKNNFSVFNSKILSSLSNSFYKKYIFYIGKCISNPIHDIHVGNSFLSFFLLLRGKSLTNSYYFRLLSKNLSLNLFSSETRFDGFLRDLGIFDTVKINNFNFYSNISGYFEFGLNSDMSLQSQDKGNILSYYYKTTKVQDNNTFLYHGNYLPILEEECSGNYIFLPSSNLFEVEDIYINIFGDLQTSNQVIDFSEKEEIKSDFYILKNIFFNFFYNFTKRNNVSFFYSFDLISGELLHFYFNYFLLTFDYVPYLCNYNKNSFFLSEKKNFYFFYSKLTNSNIKDSFFVRYSSTLRTFYKLRSKKESHSFF